MTNLKSLTKIKIALALALGSLQLIACETQPIVTPSNSTLPSSKNETQPLPQTTNMRVGQSLVVVLPTKPGSDLIWRVQKPLPLFLSLISDSTSSLAADGTGTPDQQVFNFTANREGEGNLAFLLGHPRTQDEAQDGVKDGAKDGTKDGVKVGALNAAAVEIRTTLVRVSAP